MKNRYSFRLLIMLCVLTTFPYVVQAQAPHWQWAVQSTGTASSTASVRASATDAAGNIYVTGVFGGSVTFGPTTLTGSGDSYVAKLSPTGQWLWAVQTGGNAFSSHLVVAATGTVYVAGTYQGSITFGTTTLANRGQQDIFVAQLSATGQWLTAARAGGPQFDSCSGLAVAGADVYLSGFYEQGVAFDNLTTLSSLPATGYGFVAKLTGTQWQWATNLGLYGGNSVAVSPSTGEVYVSGDLVGTTVTFGATVLSSAQGNVGVARIAAATGLIQGVAQGGGRGGNNTSLIFDSRGRLVLTGRYGLNNQPGPFGPTTLPGAGSTSTTGNGYVACLDPTSLTWQWASALVSSGQVLAGGLAPGLNGEICVVGSFTGTLGSLTSTGQFFNQYNGFLVRMSATGQVLLADQTTGGGNLALFAVGVDSGGQLYVGGAFTGTATFGATTLTSPNANANVNTLCIAKTGLLLGNRLVTVTEPLGLFPNPAQRTATLLTPKNFPITGGEVRIHNALGQLVHQQVLPAGTTRLALPVGSLAAGSYVVQLRSGARLAVQRLQVE